MTKTMTKTKTKTKCLKNPTYAIFLKSWWLTQSKYDDRYLTLVILFTLVAGHPGYPDPVIQSVLQGRVYHCFGIFSVFFTLDLSGNSWKIERSKSSTKYIKTFVVRALASLRQNCHVLKQSLLFQCLSYILRRKLSFHQRLKKNKLSFVQLWTKGSCILFEALNTQC